MENKIKKPKITESKDIVKCPFCGAQFHPSEIFNSADLLGEPKDILKDPLGVILTNSEDNSLMINWRPGREPVATEHFVCEYCDNTFSVSAVVKYTASPVSEEEDFTDLTSSLK